MIINFKVNNFKGIEKEAIISSRASNKIKRDSKECSLVNNELKLLKTICIIGCNGSGKTSIVNALQTLQDFLRFPLRKMMDDDEDYAKYIQSLTEDELKRHLIKINTLTLGMQNINRKLDKTELEIELYIPKKNDNISGFYTYKLTYDKDYKTKGVILEKLTYRPKYEKRNILTLCKKSAIIESQIGTTVLYRNNSIKNKDIKYVDYYQTFIDEMLLNTNCFFNGATVDLRETLKNYKKEFINLCNIADDKIINVTIDENNDNRNLLFLNNKGNSLYFTQLSDGTKKIIILGSVIIEALENNSILFIDELEQSLHFSLATFLIKMIESKNSNNYTQLLFTTHSPLIALKMKNDQLYFINNHNDEYYFSNITNAIRSKLITKDQSIQKALFDNLLIKNPDTNKINLFLNNKDKK